MTGWSNGLSQDYNGKLGTWFADRLGAKQQLRNDMETKNEALELAHIIEDCMSGHLPVSRSEIAAMLRSQANEIERLTEWQQGAKDVASTSEWHRGKREEAEKERDQLKSKLEQLTSGDVELPEPAKDAPGLVTGRMVFRWYTKYQLIDYGNRRAAQAVTSFLERSGKYLTNDTTREAAVKAAVLAERERCAFICDRQQREPECPERASYCADEIRKGEQA